MVCVECCTTRVVCCMVCVERCTMRVVCCMVCVACCVLYATFQNDSVCSPTISAYAVYSAAATEGCPFHLRDAIQRTISTCPTRRVPARLRRTRMHKHACTPLLPFEWIGRVCDHDRIDNFCLPIRDGVPTVENTPLIHTSKPPKQSTSRHAQRTAVNSL